MFEDEGGFVNHPDDPGGATNKGITIQTLRNYRNDNTLTEEDVKAITNEEAAAIYKKEYWDTVNADALPKGLATLVADTSVNSGPSRAAKLLQQTVGVTADGVIGPKTLAAVRSMDESEVIRNLASNRMMFLQGLRNWDTFKRGWTKRVDRVSNVALAKAAETAGA